MVDCTDKMKGISLCKLFIGGHTWTVILHLYRQIGRSEGQWEEETWRHGRTGRLPSAARRLCYAHVWTRKEKGKLTRVSMWKKWCRYQILHYVAVVFTILINFLIITQQSVCSPFLFRCDGLILKSRKMQIESALSASWWVKQTGRE